MTDFKVRIVREQGYSCQPRGARHLYFGPGDHDVPRDMDHEIARRCIESGCGVRIEVKGGAPENKDQPRAKAEKRKDKKKRRTGGKAGATS